MSKKQQQPEPGYERWTQWVKIAVKDRFKKEVEDLAVPINASFGLGKQVTAAMWVWLEFVPVEFRLFVLAWALGLGPAYDPTIGERVREAIRRELLRQSHPQGGNPDKPGTGR